MDMENFIDSFAYQNSAKHSLNMNETKVCKKMKYDENVFYDLNTSNLHAPNVLVFDTETASLSGSVIQLGYLISDCCGNIIESYCEYLKLDDEEIDPGSERIHKISKHTLEKKGKEAGIEIDRFIRICTHAVMNNCRVIAHNSRFDVSRINFTAEKYGIQKHLDVRDTFCTMKNATPRCGLLKVDGKTKQPTNAELYRILMKKDPPENLHDALEDCKVTLKSYVEGCVQGWW